MEERVLTPEERWQQSEDERLEYEGYCRKIIQGMENQDEKSGIRAIWELVQNAKDQSKAARIKMELTDKSFIFLHHGTPFDYTSFRALVKQDSSKDRADADLVGQYGTGFMTTHSLNRLVYVSTPFAVKTEEGISGYVQIKDFALDRRRVDTTDGPGIMREQLGYVKNFWKKTKYPSPIDDTTSFRYDLQPEQVAEVSVYLESAIRLMPFVLVLNDSISEVEIDDQYINKHYSFKKKGVNENTPLEQDGWRKVKEVIELANVTTGHAELMECSSLRSINQDVVIIPPFPTFCGDVKSIPSLFLWLPLLGTEDFGVNFIFHSKRFYPVEKRNNIMLPGVSQISKEKGGENERILREMMAALFAYYSKAENAKTLDLKMCQVSFPEVAENEETQRFFKEMQDLWKAEVPKWKVLPVGEEMLSVDDERVRLLNSDFYKRLTSEQCQTYEPVMAQYAATVKRANEEAVLLPKTDLIAWSKTVDRWHCDRDKEFFVTVANVCDAIKDNGDHLHTYLLFLKDSGNEKLMEEYPLLPNRKGDLCLRNSLYHGDFMTDDVFQLASVLLGTAAGKIFNPTFLDVCAVNPYSIENLRGDITNTLGTWRRNTIDHKPAECLEDGQLDALFKFCCASCQEEFTNQRGRMMRVLADFYQKEFVVVPTIRYLESNEEDFYKPAFNFLLDCSLWLNGQKDAEWVSSNKEWLLRFLQEYAPKDNDDRKKKLDTYGVLPNMNNGLCIKSELKASRNVPDEMVEIYKTIFGKDLKDEWIDKAFDAIVDLQPVMPSDVAGEIEKALVSDMKQDGEHKFDKEVRRIILKIRESEEWAEWFGHINDKKESYTFSMQSGKAQKSLFTLMDNLEDDDLERLSKLGEDGNIAELIDKMERIQQLEYESAARFNHLHTIGKHIEDVLRESIGTDAIKAVMPENKDDVIVADDIQDGQDIIINLKVNGDWKEIYYIEVKSKWDFSIEPAHMSTRQVRMASLHSDKYALCCVDLRPYKNEDLANLPKDKILGATKVKMDIGRTLFPLMSNILDAEKQSDDVQIKISEYRSNISAKVFEQGEPFGALIAKIEEVARIELNN